MLLLEGMIDGKSEGVADVDGELLRVGLREGETLIDGAFESVGLKLGSWDGLVEGRKELLGR
jgi:hypothetical protein